MPRVKLDYVVSFSSEDPENQASNLLACEVTKKKWLCNAGEPSCSVVLQLSRSVQIATVHIGAYHAALVEVLVGRSETPNDFEVLVPSSVFVSPAESRRAGAERVRSFSGAQLGAPRAARWDRVRVVCSQPYNKHCKYGLSFIHIFEPEDSAQPEPEAAIEVPKPAPAVPPRMMAIDNFSSDEDDFKPGELFAQHQKRISDAGNSDTVAQIRQATSQALKNIPDPSTRLVKTPLHKTDAARPSAAAHAHAHADRRRASLMYTDDDESPHSKIDAIVQRHKDDKEHEREKKEPPKKDKATESKLANSSKNFRDFIDANDDLNNSKKESRDDKKKDLDRSRSKDCSKDLKKDLNSRSKDDRRNKDDEGTPYRKTDSSQKKDSKKRPHPDEKQKGKDELRPGPVSAAPHTLLSDVVFALSGYENPRRARLRDAAVAMGARFSRDWSPDCTHLICAFPNTPKLRSVRAAKSDCIAVLGEWVEGCCERRRRLPWQWFATEPRHRAPAPASWAEDASGDSTECDTDDEIEKALRKQKRRRIDSSSPQNDKSPKPHTSREISPESHANREISPRSHASREKSPKPHTSKEKTPKPNTSRETTPKGSDQNSSNVSSNSDVVFTKDERIQGNITINSDSDETDEEKPVIKEKVNKKRVLPDFFEGYTFLIDEKVEEAGFDVELLSRYVKAYGGVVVDACQVDSDSEISYVLAAARAAAVAGSRRVRADWVWRCHERGALCDPAEFAL